MFLSFFIPSCFLFLIFFNPPIDRTNYSLEWLLEIWPFQDKKECGKGRAVARRSDRKLKEESPGIAGCGRYFGMREREADDRSWWLFLNSSQRKNWIFSILPQTSKLFHQSALTLSTSDGWWKSSATKMFTTSTVVLAIPTTATAPTTLSDSNFFVVLAPSCLKKSPTLSVGDENAMASGGKRRKKVERLTSSSHTQIYDALLNRVDRESWFRVEWTS